MITRLEFVAESNWIEGILRDPTQDEIAAHEWLWRRQRIAVSDVEIFVRHIADVPLRREPWQNVQVGDHSPPPGGPHIEDELAELLRAIHAGELTPYEAHQRYELLHPFMDGNGRSGRALWAWHMMLIGQDPFALPFLHAWYYQSLDAASRAPREGE